MSTQNLTYFVFFFISLISLSIKAQFNCNDNFQYGEATTYGGVAGGKGGNCGLFVSTTEIYHAAMNEIDYDGSNGCGACVRVLGPKGEVTMRIVDRCPECAKGDIDMTQAAFEEIANLKDGRIDIKWQYVSCPIKGDIVFFYKEGSSQYHTELQVLNHKYPIVDLAYVDTLGDTLSINRELYNFFREFGGIDGDKTQAGPYTFVVTDITGQKLVAENVPFAVAQEVEGGVQFPGIDCPDCAGMINGSALIDNCNVCSGGSTGIIPNSLCETDCNGYWRGNAYVDDCSTCVNGSTGRTPCGLDCFGNGGGSGYIDACGECVLGEVNTIGWIVSEDACEIKLCDGKIYTYTSKAVTALKDYCESDDGWLHYFDTLQPNSILFSIYPNGNEVKFEPSIQIANAPFQRIVEIESRIAMARTWSISASGVDYDTQTGELENPIKIRFYYLDEEKQEIETLLPNSIDVNRIGFEWVKSQGGQDLDFNMISLFTEDPNFLRITDFIELTTSTGIQYVEFANIESLSNGTGITSSTEEMVLDIQGAEIVFSKEIKAKVYPSITKDLIHVDVQNPKEAMVVVYDNYGQFILHREITISNNTISLLPYVAGYYHVVVDSNGQKEYYKVFKK